MRACVPRTIKDARLQQFARVWWGEVKAFAPHDHAHWPAIRVGISVTLPLALTLALGHVDWAPYAIFGSVNSAYGKHHNYDARLRVQVGTGLALTAAVFTGTAVGAIAPASLLAVIAMATFSVLGYLLAKVRGWLPIPSLFLVFAVGTLSSYEHRWSDLILATMLPLLAGGVSVLIGQLGRLLPPSPRARQVAPVQTPLRQTLQASPVRLDLLAYFLGPLLAGTAATTAGIGHPYWAAVTATVPLTGANLAAQVARATLRLAGTLAGVGIAYLLLAGPAPAWALVTAIAILQVFTELFVARNYGIAVIAITPMALILTYLGSPEPVDVLVVDRIVETAIGAVVTVLLLVAVHPLHRPPAAGRH